MQAEKAYSKVFYLCTFIYDNHLGNVIKTLKPNIFT